MNEPRTLLLLSTDSEGHFNGHTIQYGSQRPNKDRHALGVKHNSVLQTVYENDNIGYLSGLKKKKTMTHRNDHILNALGWIKYLIKIHFTCSRFTCQWIPENSQRKKSRKCSPEGGSSALTTTLTTISSNSIARLVSCTPRPLYIFKCNSEKAKTFAFVLLFYRQSLQC